MAIQAVRFVGPIVSGLIAHIICHRYPPASIPAFISVILLPPVVLTYLALSSSLLAYFFSTLVLYLSTLGTSIALYRLSPFHPLAKYPGPILARVSRLWATRVAASGRQNVVSHELFQRYGEVVRVGPDHLIILNINAIPVVLGAKNPWPKNPRYTVAVPYNTAGSLVGQLDPVEHSKRRKIWDRAFTPAAVKSYEPLLQKRVAQLMQELSNRSNQPVDLAEWTSFMSMDFMGDFAYGGMFDSMAHGAETTGAREVMIKIVTTADAIGTLPWLRPIFVQLIKYGNPFFQNAAMAVVNKRLEKGSEYRDLFYYLLNEDGEGTHPSLNKPTLASEAVLAILAGSDTTATALANAMYYLMTHPTCMTRLRAEVDAAADPGTEIDADKLVELSYLQAVISETLRLQPAIPNGVQRMPPHHGGPVIVAGHVVPVGTTVQIPTWSLHRDPRYFSPDPEEFWPERWLGEGAKIAESRGQDFKLNQGAYMPFNYGPGNCVGRSLALHEVRTALASLVRHFDARFAPGFQPEDWLRSLKDYSGLIKGKLEVVLSTRV